MLRIRCCVLPLLLAGLSPAQVQTSRIAGIVWQSDGAAAAGATVTVTDAAETHVRRSQTSTHGVYSISSLEPGAYTVTASAPGLTAESRKVTLAVAAGTRQDFTLHSAQSAAALRTPSPVNMDSNTLRRDFLHTEIMSLPSLNRDPFRFAELAGNVSDAGLGTRGVGLAINGQRESSTYVLLDGAGNMNEFSGSAGQPIPLDAIGEFSLLTSGFTAEQGRASGGIVSAVSRSGGNALHGSVYEFNRVARLATDTFKDNASGTAAPGFTRNQFGYSISGPILRNRLFFFNSTEGALVGDNATAYAWVPSPELLARTAANTQDFFRSLGQLRADSRRVGVVTLNDLAASTGRNPCTGFTCFTLPGSLPLFNRVAWNSPGDSGGGFAGNSVNSFSRVDYTISESTWMFVRYAFYREDNPAGVLSTSPYDNYDLGQSQLDHSFLFSGTHMWSPRLIANTTAAVSRLNILQQGLTGRGLVPSMYANPIAPVVIGTDSIALPGYNPFSPGGAGAFGGPQNVLDLNHDTSWSRGRHNVRFGGGWRYLQDNRTSAAYQTAAGSLSNGGGVGPAVNGLLSGHFTHFQVAVNPSAAVAPAFSRSNRFNDAALFLQDSWRISRRLTVTAGVRWDYFGVQHNNNPKLDSNWYAPGIGFADENLGLYLRRGSLQPVPQSPIGRLWNPQRKNFAPRIGAAWDVFGNGSTSLRGGYGTGYERNFGNVTFNIIQNLPNYAVIDVPGPVTASNGPPSTGALPSRSGARIVDPELKTAHAEFWNAAIERRLSRSVIYSLEYSGSKGVNLYSISYPNQAGFGNAVLGDPCTGNGDCRSQPNPGYTEDVGFRGNQGSSTYWGINNQVRLNNFLHRGIGLTATYTWSHAIDNLSSTFFEAGGQGVQGLYGNRNITVNNGNFDAGLLDPYHPDLDRGDADFDVRHRVTLSGNWDLNLRPGRTGRLNSLLHGWSFNPLFIARSGQPFSVFDTSAQTLDLNAPRATFVKSVPLRKNTFVASTAPDTFHLFTFLPAQISSQPNPLAPGSQFSAGMSHRNAFRAPGFWNFDLSVHKETKINDRFTLDLRGEAFNVFNHANLYIIGSTADLGTGNTVDGCFGCTGSAGDRRLVQLAARIRF